MDETGSPRLRMPLPSPSTPEDWHAMPDLHTPDPHPHPHHHHPPHSADVFTSSAHSPLEKERCREFGFPSSRTLSPGGRGGRDDRRAHYPRFHERRAPAIINGFEGDGCQPMKDPRQAGYNRTKLEHRRVLREHSYSRRYQEKYNKHPRFRRIEPCSDFNPQFLTPLRSSSTAAKSPNQTTAKDKPQSEKKEEKDSKSSTSLVGSGKASGLYEKPPPPSAISSTRPTPSGNGAESAKSLAPSAATTSQERSLPSSDSSSAMTVEHKTGSEVTNLSGGKNSEKSDMVQAKQKSLDGEELAPQTKPRRSKTHSDEKKASSSPLTGEDLSPLNGFHLDLDLEATTSGSNSTCCSESEEMAEERGGNDSDAKDKKEGMEVDGTESSSDESASLTLEDSSPRSLEKKSPEKWSVCLPEPGKIRFSRLDNIEDSSDSERLSVKQMTSNRIQLRNGRVLPSSSLAFFTTAQKVLSPPPHPQPSTTTKSSPAGSPSRLRRSKRLAMAGEEGTTPQSGSTTSSDAIADQSFEMQLSEEGSQSSDESEFELPAFEPVPLKPSLPESPLPKTPPVRGKRGRGRGRRGRRWGKRGGIQNTNGECVGIWLRVYIPKFVLFPLQLTVECNSMYMNHEHGKRMGYVSTYYSCVSVCVSSLSSTLHSTTASYTGIGSEEKRTDPI